MKRGSLMFRAIILFFIPACGCVFHLIGPSFVSNTVHERDENSPLNFTTCFLKASCFENLSFFFQLLNSSFLQAVRFSPLWWRQVKWPFSTVRCALYTSNELIKVFSYTLGRHPYVQVNIEANFFFAIQCDNNFSILSSHLKTIAM